MVAEQKQGGVMIRRYKDATHLEQQIKDFSQTLLLADSENAVQPRERQIWITGCGRDSVLYKDLFKAAINKPGRTVFWAEEPLTMLWFQVTKSNPSIDMLKKPSTPLFFLDAVSSSDIGTNIRRLYGMLSPQNFEFLISHLLLECKNERFDPADDYVVRLFLE